MQNSFYVPKDGINLGDMRMQKLDGESLDIVSEKVKIIYIDLPYDTRKDFV